MTIDDRPYQSARITCQNQVSSPQNHCVLAGEGRGKSRGGLGKYLRAHEVVVESISIPDSEEAKELQQKYARRHLGSNADRYYAEPERELDSDGEEIREPEIDLSSFLARQRLSDVPTVVAVPRVN
ncbi:hypothetical protein DFJ58DRAFT_726856 [Suillus subalutaceus]|uniref:uncharacterized protein n=1 Tax=Suillus subalutaceus TaxID=48586 RepID=UPI001B87A4E6|nr:uncharacterized protein DFJ58DRAFT_726856 [Suillus subalutaceus]KAG1857732.1 hypothetical protein DFJ58DRAFT_726856 [Suillus subalutaceus]